MDDLPKAKFVLLPPKPGVCQVCAATHDPAQPHNRDSLYYQYHFYAENGRWPNWADAMSHCDEATKQTWKQLLREHGVPEDQLTEAGEEEQQDVDQRE